MYQCLIGNPFNSHLLFLGEPLVLIAPVLDTCLLLPYHCHIYYHLPYGNQSFFFKYIYMYSYCVDTASVFVLLSVAFA